MSPSLKLDSHPNGKKVDVPLYRGMIGSLLYLIANRPDIMLKVCLYSRYQAEPTKLQPFAVQWIMRYLVGTPHLGIWYPKWTSCSLKGYTVANFTGSRTDRKST